MGKAIASLTASPEAILSGLVRDVCEAVSTPRSLAVWLLFSNKEHRQLLDLEIDALWYQDAHSFADDYLVTAFLSKYPYLETGIDTKAKSMENFHKFEQQCRDTNANLQKRLLSSERAARVIWAASEKCKRWLPVLVPDQETDQRPLTEILHLCEWGPGVTSAVKGKALAAYKKFQGNLEATTNLIAVGAHHLVNAIPMWSTYHASGTPDNPSSVTPNSFIRVPGNTVTVVPKNAKTDRTIAVEPHVNAFIQRGVGKYLRKVLKRHGTDLRSQERNQHLARQGSLTGKLATIDLKGASDTVSRAIVRELLPADWVHFLDNLRSPCYQIDGTWHTYHKHSSMGNGYTFELETLIFVLLSICACDEVGVSSKDVSVYGDDIIIPVEAYDVLKEVLETCGFTINEDKSYHEGPFRESCGEDYFRGINVRPFFVREKLSSPGALFRVANNLRRYCAMRNASLGCDARLKRAWKGLYFAVTSEYRFRIPDGIGDGGFVSEWDESASAVTAGPSGPYGRTWRTKSLEFVPTTRMKSNSCLSVASTLYDLERGRISASVSQSSDSERLYLDPQPAIDRTAYGLREVGSWRVRTIVVMQWPSLGGWI